MALIRLILVLSLTPFLGGCIAFEIRDELRATNKKMDDIQQKLSEVDQKLAASNGTLASIQQDMEPIRISLRRIDDELAGYRQTLEKIDKVVPGKITPDTPPPAKQEPTHETTPQK
jgi:septal ring factor EnvC (AmiA/AmiB activator)